MGCLPSLPSFLGTEVKKTADILDSSKKKVHNKEKADDYQFEADKPCCCDRELLYPCFVLYRICCPAAYGDRRDGICSGVTCGCFTNYELAFIGLLWLVGMGIVRRLIGEADETTDFHYLMAKKIGSIAVLVFIVMYLPIKHIIAPCIGGCIRARLRGEVGSDTKDEGSVESGAHNLALDTGEEAVTSS